MFFFFFSSRRRHTRLVSDWSSDVCSSDLTPGDDVRRIVWRAFARTGQLLVRESEQGITDKVTILLDQNAEHHSRSEERRVGKECRSRWRRDAGKKKNYNKQYATGTERDEQ